MIKKALPLLLCLLLLAGCGQQASQGEATPPQSSPTQSEQGESTMEPGNYKQITPEEAKAMMDEQEDYILLVDRLLGAPTEQPEKEKEQAQR